MPQFNWFSLDYVHADIIDKELLIKGINDFDMVTIGNESYHIQNKPQWLAFIEFAFEIIPSLQPQVIEEEEVAT